MAIHELVVHSLLAPGPLLLAALLLYGGVLWYRIYFSPLSTFPGPKLAAASDWYEFYFDFIHKGGSQFAFHIDELHKQYGPFVRITPWEVHVNDFRFYDSIYSYQLHHDKPEHLKWRAGQPHNVFSTPDHHLHRRRRAAINPYFSKARVSAFSQSIQKRMDSMCRRLQREYAGKSKVLNVGDMWGCVVADTTAEYIFHKDYNWTETAIGFQCPLLAQIDTFADIMHCVPLFPVLGMALHYMPPALVRALIPGLNGAMDFVKEIATNVYRIQSPDYKPLEGENQNIIYDLLHSDLPKEERRPGRIISEAMGIVSASLETSKTALEKATFRVLNDSAVYNKLKNEIMSIWADPLDSAPELTKLEALPYLTACVEEAFRLSYGTPTRLPRVPREPLLLGDKVIPPGYMVATQALSVMHDPEVFPNPWEYIPERWMDPVKRRELKQHLVTFGKGTRVCIGQQMAYAVMTMAIANLVRRVDLALFETDRSDVDLARASFKPRPKKGSLGIRAVVQAVAM